MGALELKVWGLSGLELALTHPPHVSGMLVDILDPRESKRSSRGRIPLPDEPNTFRGILKWKKRDDSILAPTIYSKTEGVMRRITTVEMAQVMDFPVCHTERMKETDVRLLIDGDVPGKFIQAAIYFVARWNLMITTPSRVKRSREVSEVQVISKRPRMQDEMKKEEGLVEDEEEEVEIEVLDFVITMRYWSMKLHLRKQHGQMMQAFKSIGGTTE